nr:hypothetical protein CFP56_02117 [Quercus suber]
MRRQEHPSKRFVHKARPSHGEVVQANGVDTRPCLLRAEEQGRGIAEKARPSGLGSSSNVLFTVITRLLQHTSLHIHIQKHRQRRRRQLRLRHAPSMARARPTILLLHAPLHTRRSHCPRQTQPRSLPRELHVHRAPDPLPQPPLAPDLHDRLPRHLRRLVFPLLPPRPSTPPLPHDSRRSHRLGLALHHHHRRSSPHRRLAQCPRFAPHRRRHRSPTRYVSWHRRFVFRRRARRRRWRSLFSRRKSAHAPPLPSHVDQQIWQDNILFDWEPKVL